MWALITPSNQYKPIALKVETGFSVIVCDPMLETDYSAVSAVNTLIGRGVPAENIRFLALVAAPEGIKVFHAAHPTVPLYVAGLGDAGDRIFGTKHD